MDPKQIELDAFENKLLSAIFGNNWRNSAEFKLLEVFKPGMVQKAINKFEIVIGAFMNENGTINGYLLKQALLAKGSMFADIVPDKDFNLSVLVDEVANLIKEKAI